MTRPRLNWCGAESTLSSTSILPALRQGISVNA